MPAKGFLELPGHLRFLDCKEDAKCLAGSTEALVEMYSTQVLNKMSDISGGHTKLDGREIVA